MALAELQIDALVGKYLRERDRYEKLTAIVARELGDVLHANQIRHILQARSKSPDSLRRKLKRDADVLSFEVLQEEFCPTLLDVAGARVLLYDTRESARVATLVEQLFDVDADPRMRKDHNLDETHKYQARHRVVRLKPDESDATRTNLRGVLCEVQITSLAKHVWNEIEHDIQYKTPNGKPTASQSAYLFSLWGQLDGAEAVLRKLTEETDRIIGENLRTIDSPEELHRVLLLRLDRVITGDWERLFALFQVLRPLTPAALDKLAIRQQDLEAGRAAAQEALGVDAHVDDAMAIVCALWSELGEDFAEIAANWAGVRTPLANLIARLSAPGTPPAGLGQLAGGTEASKQTNPHTEAPDRPAGEPVPAEPAPAAPESRDAKGN